MPLLKVHSSGSGHASVSVWCDAVAFRKPDYGDIHDIMAMSLFGPEQAIRSIGAGCALDKEGQRVFLDFSANGRTIMGRWKWKWPQVRALKFEEGPMHLVAIADSNTEGSESQHLVVPSSNTDEALEAAIYDTLLAKYTTPLIPCDRTGQPGFEKLSGKLWRRWVVSEIKRDRAAWQECIPHPEQIDRSWVRAGVLGPSQLHLDQIVSRLMKTGRLSIPVPALV